MEEEEETSDQSGAPAPSSGLDESPSSPSVEEGGQSVESSKGSSGGSISSPTLSGGGGGGGKAPLTPWHRWLLKKEVERREAIKKFKLLQRSSTSPRKTFGTADPTKRTAEEREKALNEWASCSVLGMYRKYTGPIHTHTHTHTLNVGDSTRQINILGKLEDNFQIVRDCQ